MNLDIYYIYLVKQWHYIFVGFHVGFIHITFVIFIEYVAGKFICGSAEDLQKPTFINEPFDIVAYEGTTIELPCAGKGNPKPEVIFRIHSYN